MDVSELLLDLFGRVDEHVHAILDGLEVDDLLISPEEGSNPIGWLVWHLDRVQDDHVAEVAGDEQVWVEGAWASRFGLDPGTREIGYGHTAEQVAAVRPESTAALLEYHDAVAARTRQVLAALTPDDLDRIVDERWDPPVTLGVRLISVADDDVQHAGQAAYIKGLLERR